MRFSEREGFRPVRTILQRNSVDEPLLNGLWNIIADQILSWSDWNGYDGKTFYELLWTDHYKQRADQKPGSIFVRQYIARVVFETHWYEIYDLIQYSLEYFNFDSGQFDEFVSKCNHCFKREMSAWRIVGGTISLITSEEEIAAVEEACAITDNFAPVAMHIKRGLELLSDRKAPDYRNSIKEAISAVESMCAIITNNLQATLGEALKQLEASGVIIHPALKGAFNQMYGYASGAQGIRHGLGLTEEANLDFDDAKFMLVSSSAFVNLLRARSG